MKTPDTHTAYCSACDRQVQVTLDPGYRPRPGEAIPPEAMVCLAHGDSCTGALCPLFGIPPATMKDNIERSGFRKRT